MAQLVEQRIRNAWVAGSSPAIGSYDGALNKESLIFFSEREPLPMIEGQTTLAPIRGKTVL